MGFVRKVQYVYPYGSSCALTQRTTGICLTARTGPPNAPELIKPLCAPACACLPTKPCIIYAYHAVSDYATAIQRKTCASTLFSCTLWSRSIQNMLYGKTSWVLLRVPVAGI